MGFQNQIFKKAIVPLIIISMVTSCTIQKGHYLDGYRVKWNEHIKTKEYSAAVKAHSDSTNDPVVNNDLSASSDTEIVPIIIQSTPVFYPENKIVGDSTKQAQLKKRDAKRKLKKQLERKPEPKKKKSATHYQATNSLVSGILSVALSILTIALIIAAIYYFDFILAALSLLAGIVLTLVSFAFGVNAIIEGAIALNNIKKKPEDDKYKKKSQTGLILGLIGFAAFISIVAWAFSSL